MTRSTLTPIRLLATVALAAGLAGCISLAELSAPAKHASATRSPQALQADRLFWQTLHGGDYDGIATALQAETGAYLDNPDDAITAAHVGWLHIWRLAESGRMARIPPTITDDATLARRYFEEAVALDPHEARYQGFLASAQLADGAIHHDDALKRRGYATLKASIEAWPEFNLFTGGYVMSALPADSPQFREGLAWQWDNLDACAGAHVDRQQPDFSRYAASARIDGPRRACAESAIAPHNVEGFFLDMGDMLVKAGDWQTARQVYANAQDAPDFATWPFAATLRSHLAHAQENVARFNGPASGRGKPGDQMMAVSTMACMACHQQ